MGTRRVSSTGLDTSLSGLASRLGAEEKRVPRCGRASQRFAREVADATEAAKGNDASAAAAPLMKVVAGLNRVSDEVTGRVGECEREARFPVADRGETATGGNGAESGSGREPHRRCLFRWAARDLHALKEADALTTVSPGQEFLIAVTFHNGSKQPLVIDHIKLEVPAGWNTISGRDKAGDGKARRRSACEFPAARAEGYDRTRGPTGIATIPTPRP